MNIKRIHFNTIGSTNTWAKQNAEHFEFDMLTLVTADAQTAGRGRFNRVWSSPPNVNIYATYCFYMDLERTDLGHIPQLLALSASQALEKRSVLTQLKWPNDILLSSKKLSGILCETITNEKGRCIICGIGLNVNMTKEMLDLIDRPATSLFVEFSQSYSVENILQEITDIFLSNLIHFLKNNFTQFFEQYQAKSCYVKGQPIQFHYNNNLVKGLFEKLNNDGSVSIKTEHNEIKTFYAGEFI